MLKALQLSHFLSSRPFNDLLSDNDSQSGAVSSRSIRRVDALQATSSGYQTTFRIPEGGRLRECRLYNCMISCTTKLFKGADSAIQNLTKFIQTLITHFYSFYCQVFLK